MIKFVHRVSAFISTAILCSSLEAFAQQPSLVGIAHVAFRVSYVELSIDFYRKLGFEQAFVFTDNGNITESFIKISDHQFVELYPQTLANEPVGQMHVCYESERLEQLARLFERKGLAPSKINKGRAGNLVFAVFDVQHETIEFTQYLAGSLHSEDLGKHLSRTRIADSILAAGIAIPDPQAAIGLYRKMGFLAPPHTSTLVVPGPKHQEIRLASEQRQRQPPVLVLHVLKTPVAAQKIQQAGILLKRTGTSVEVTDPDGNLIAFTEALAPHKRILPTIP